jgi:outer membrane protein
MSPRKRQIIAWLAPISVLGVVCTAWWLFVSPNKPSEVAEPDKLTSTAPLMRKERSEREAKSDLAQSSESSESLLDWSPPIRPIQRLAAKKAESPKLVDDSHVSMFPRVRASKVSAKTQPSGSTPNQFIPPASQLVLEGPQKTQSVKLESSDSMKPISSEPPALRRLNAAQDSGESQSATPEVLQDPTTDDPAPGDCWWKSEVGVPLRLSDRKWSIQLDDLLLLALEHSDLVQSLRIEPLIQQTEIALETAAFDPAAFVDSKWNDLSDPVGNTLVTGGPDRLNEHHLENKAGLRQKNRLGGRLEAAQELNLRDSNSVFFRPNNQANTRMVLSYTQPLMRGRGRCYNEGFVVLAQIDTDIARRQLEQRLQDHLLDVADAYWNLYLQRARLVQQRRALDRTIELQEELENRAEIDVVRSQILRARGAVAQRRSGVKRAEVGVKNQEAIVWSLTNAPDLANRKVIEILPESGPDCRPLPLNSAGSVTEAINRRPEIAVVFEKIHAAQTRLGIAEHELLPTLNLVMETYVRGLDGDYDVGRSLSRQFDSGAPSYSIGLSFLMPYGNAAAKANLSKRQLEMSQLAHELNATLKRVTVEVENSLRDIEATQVEITANTESLEAAAAEFDYLLDRWRMLPGEDRLASLLLDEALGALDRLVFAEAAYAQSQVDYALAITRYKRAAGMLLQMQPVSPDRPLLERAPRETVQPPVGRTARQPSRAAR